MIPLPDGVELGAFTKEGLKGVWESLKDFDPLFSDKEMRKPEVFLDEFLSNNSLILTTKEGFVLLDNIIPDLRGEVHFSFFDKRLSGREEMMREVLLWFFLTYNLKRIETFIPSYAKAVERFLLKVGLKKEGVLRDRVFHKDLLLDVYVYGILLEEVLDGNV